MIRGRLQIVGAAVTALVVATLGALGGLATGGLERVVRHAPRDVAFLLTDAPPIVAHRGFSGAAPENTMAAFRRAADLGVMIELDVTLAASGEVVVIHDDTLGRTTNGTGRVEDTSLDALRRLDAGSWFGPQFAGEQVPTLDQVLDEIDGQVVIDIELKTTDRKEALAKAVVDAVHRSGHGKRVFVSSFDPLLLEQVRLADPDLRRAQLVGTFEGTDLAWYEKVVLKNLGLNGQAQPDMIIGGDDFVSEPWVKRQKRRGYAVMVYTINDPERMAELWGWGVDAVITDVPDVARTTLR